MSGGKLMVNVGERGGGDFGGQTNGWNAFENNTKKSRTLQFRPHLIKRLQTFGLMASSS
jgi:hypothetical protein